MRDADARIALADHTFLGTLRMVWQGIPGLRVVTADGDFAELFATLMADVQTAPPEIVVDGEDVISLIDTLPKTATTTVQKEPLRADDARNPSLRVMRPGVGDS